MDKETEKDPGAGKTKMIMYLVAAFTAGALIVGVVVFTSGAYLQGSLSNPFLPADKQPCGMTACTALKNATDADKLLRKDINSLSAMISDVNKRLGVETNTRMAVQSNFEAQFTDVNSRIKALQDITGIFLGHFTKTNNQLKALGQPGLW